MTEDVTGQMGAPHSPGTLTTFQEHEMSYLCA